MEPVLMRAVAMQLALIALAFASAQGQKDQPDLTTLKIEDLMDVEVTSASKKEQKLSKVPAAIFVISEEDIRRSGATNIPDLLRMVPGLEVAQVTPSVWAISARGFNGQYSDKLLVWIYGRLMYTSLFSGVYLGCCRRATRVHRPHRGHSRTRGDGLGDKRRERSDQHHYQERAGQPGRIGGGCRRDPGAWIRDRALRGKDGSRGAYRLSANGFEAGHFTNSRRPERPG